MNSQDAATATPPLSEPLPNFIATNLRILRKAAGWSQTELAERVGLNRGNIASYESGSAEPSICKLLRLSNLFDVSTRDLTRRDFADPTELALARSQYQLAPQAEQQRYTGYQQRHDELAQLIKASHDLFTYKRDRLERPCKEAELLAAHYLQLFELSKQLLQEQRQLLDEVDCTCR